MGALAFSCLKEASIVATGPAHLFEHPDAALLLKDELDLREGEFEPSLLAGVWSDLKARDPCHLLSGMYYLEHPSPLVFLPDIHPGFALFDLETWGRKYRAETGRHFCFDSDAQGVLSNWIKEVPELGPYDSTSLELFESSLAAMQKLSPSEFSELELSQRGYWLWVEMDLGWPDFEPILRGFAAHGVQRVGLSCYGVGEPLPAPNPDE